MKKWICLFSMVLALSCAEEKSEVPVLNLADAGKVDVHPDFVLNDIVESVTYLQLESRDSIFHSMPVINSINDNGDYCFVDMMNNSTISIYNKEGKLLSNFSRMGRGEAEYIDVSSLLYDGDDTIEVLYSEKNVIYQYNKKGEYKSKVNIEGSIRVRLLENGKYLSLMFANKEKNILDFVRIVDKDGNVCDRFLQIDTTQVDGVTTRENSITRCADGYDFSLSTQKRGDLYCHYNMKENRVSEICGFDLGKYKLTDDVLINGGNPNDYIIMIQPFKVENYLFIQFFNRGDFSIDLWDLTTNKMIARRSASASSKGLLNYQLPNGESLGISWGTFTVHNDQLILICEPSKLAGKIPDNIDPEGNQVIVTFKLKK